MIATTDKVQLETAELTDGTYKRCHVSVIRRGSARRIQRFHYVVIGGEASAVRYNRPTDHQITCCLDIMVVEAKLGLCKGLVNYNYIHHIIAYQMGVGFRMGISSVRTRSVT